MSDAPTIKDFVKTDHGKFNIEISTFIKASPETVYGILSNNESFEEFMSCKIKEEIKPGGPINFIFDVAWTDENGVTHDPPAISTGKIMDMIPNELFSFTWGDGRGFNKDFLPGSTLVEFKIKPETQDGLDGCRVTIDHSDLLSEHMAKDHSGGWQYHLQNCINKFA